MKKKQYGLTFIELLIVMVLGIFVMAIVLQVLQGVKSTEKYTNGLSRLEENGRMVMQLLSNDIQMAGYQGCADLSQVPPNVVATNPPISDLQTGALKGWVFNNTDWASSDGSSAPTGSDDALINSDMIQVARGSFENLKLAADMLSNGEGIQVTADQLTLEQGDLVIIANCENVDIFRVSNVPNFSASTVTLQHAAGPHNTSSQLSTAYKQTDTRVMKFNYYTYFIGNTFRRDRHGNELNALYRLDENGVAEEISEGIEGMKIRYGESTSSGNFRFYSADNSQLDWPEISSIELSFLVSSEPVLDQDDKRNYILAGETFGPGSAGSLQEYPSNKRLRKPFSSIVEIKNRANTY